MSFSYSFHLSAKSHALTTSGKVGQASRHNLREYKSERYDRDQIEILQGSNKSILDDVKQIYHEEFDECLERYNATKRADRQIDDYLKHISDSKSDVACEFIVQVGDMDFWKDKTMDEKKQMSYIFRDQLRALQKLVPELKVASAVIHYDESSPHMHVVGVPVAEGYKKGLEKQVSKTKVFTAARLSYLQDKMRENAEKGMNLEQNRNLFGGLQLKEKETGRNKDIPKSSMEEYRQLQRDVSELREEIELSGSKIEEQQRTLEENARQICDDSVQRRKLKQEIKSLEQDAAKAKLDMINKENESRAISNILTRADRVAVPDTGKPSKLNKDMIVLLKEDYNRLVEGYKLATAAYAQAKQAARNAAEIIGQAREREREIVGTAQSAAKEIKSQALREASEIKSHALDELFDLREDNKNLRKRLRFFEKMERHYPGEMQELEEKEHQREKLERSRDWDLSR